MAAGVRISMPGPDRPGAMPRLSSAKPYVPASVRALARKGYSARLFYQRNPAAAAAASGIITLPKPKASSAPGSTSAYSPSYPEYAAYPWAQQQLRQIDADEKAHETYVSKQVAPWLSSALTALTGTDPSNPGLAGVLQQQYLANVKNIVGGSYGAAAAATPFLPQSTTPGGAVAAPNAYLGEAARQGARDTSDASVQAAQIQARLNTIIPNTQAQGSVYALADYAKGLPAVYAAKRADARAKIDQFITTAQQQAAASAETLRHHKVSEAISAQNAQTNAALGLSRLGLSADNQAFTQGQKTSAISAPAPYGYYRDPGTGRLVRDPSVPTARAATGGGSGGSQYPGGGTSTKDAQGRPRNPTSMSGVVGPWKVKPATRPANAKGTYFQGSDGKWYLRTSGTASGGSSSAAAPKPNAGKPAQSVYDKLSKGVSSGFIPSDPGSALPGIISILHDNAPDKQHFGSWWEQVLHALEQVDPSYPKLVQDWITRRQRDGTWKGTF